MCDIATGNKNTQDKSDDGIYPFYVRSQTVERINSWSFDGEAILTAGDGVGVGKVFHYSTGKIGVHQRVYILSNFTCDSKYLFHYFSSRFYGRVKRMSAKNSVDSVRMEMIADMPIYLASNDEQHKIGNLMSLLNERIETQKKIIEKYESLIRGLYHSVFNQTASTLQLKDVVSVVKGQQVNGEELLEYGKYYVMNGGTEPSGYLDVCNTPANTISISEGGNSCGYVQYNTEPFWSGGHCYSLIQKEQSVNYQYLYYFLKYKERNIMALRIGSGLPNVQKKDLERFEIRVLPTKQQNRVAEILADVSAKCDLEKRILLGWQCQKSYLLHNLFI